MSDFKRGDCNTCTLLIAKLSEMAIEYGDEDSDNNSPDANCCIGSIKNDLHELERFVKENMASGFKTFEDLEFIAVSERSGVAFINFHNGYRISVDELRLVDVNPFKLDVIAQGEVELFYKVSYEDLSQQDVTNLMRVIQTIPAKWMPDKTGE